MDAKDIHAAIAVQPKETQVPAVDLTALILRLKLVVSPLAALAFSHGKVMPFFFQFGFESFAQDPKLEIPPPPTAV